MDIDEPTNILLKEIQDMRKEIQELRKENKDRDKSNDAKIKALLDEKITIKTIDIMGGLGVSRHTALKYIGEFINENQECVKYEDPSDGSFCIIKGEDIKQHDVIIPIICQKDLSSSGKTLSIQTIQKRYSLVDGDLKSIVKRVVDSSEDIVLDYSDKPFMERRLRRK